MPLSRQLSFAVREAGSLALFFLAERRSGEVAAVFDRSIYLQAGGKHLCITAADAGMGALNATVDLADDLSWLDAGLTQGAPFNFIGDHLIIDGSMSLAFDAARAWRPPPWPRISSRSDLASSVLALRSVARYRAPAMGLSRLVLTKGALAGQDKALTRVAQLKIATLEDWLSEGLAGRRDMETSARSAVHGLMGLGPGLTPSGDDLLAGMALALHATRQSSGQSSIAASLAEHIRAAPPGTTNAISMAHLDAALADLPGQAIHAAISAIVADKRGEYEEILTTLDRVGHCSGWDMLAGGMIVLAATAGIDQ